VAVSTWARPRGPATVADLLQRLRDAGVGWQVVPARQGGGPEHGIYLCDRPRRWEELQYLGRWPDQAERWQGVVFVQQGDAGSLAGDGGERGLVAGAVSLYGDPLMLEQVRRALSR
jgi:hypothetical protein